MSPARVARLRNKYFAKLFQKYFLLCIYRSEYYDTAVDIDGILANRDGVKATNVPPPPRL